MNKVKYFNKSIELLYIFSILFLTGCSSTRIHEKYQEDRVNYKPINAEIASENAVYAMMSTDAYHDEIPFPLERIGWQLVNLNGNVTDKATFDEGCSFLKTGLAYDIYKNIETNKIVFAFRGTDDNWCDFFMANSAVLYSRQYEKAFKEIEKYLDQYPCLKLEDIVVTGHSLGGGLAIAISIRYGINAIVFDSSPVIYSVFTDEIKQASRVLIYQKGEFLSVFRVGVGSISFSKIKEAIPKNNIYQTDFKFGAGVNPHSSRPLAMNLLKLGSTIESSKLKKVCAEVKCNIEN